MGRILHSLLVAVVVFGSVSSAASVSKFCLTLHCLPQLTACLLDSQCMKATQCIDKCVDDKVCKSRCIDSYATSTLDNFLECGARKYDCIGAENTNDVQCLTPEVVPRFNLSWISGTWLTLSGKNPVVDCYDCQVTVIEPSAHEGFFNLHRSYKVRTLENKLREISRSNNFQQSESTTGIFYLSGTKAGLAHTETWYILDVAENGEYVFVYYCGNTGGARYFGAFVLVRNTSTLMGESEHIASIATKYNLDFTNFCSPNVEKCHDHNGKVINHHSR